MAKVSKLVRDKIPEIIFEKGGKCSFHIADKKEYEDRLKHKLLEEVLEFNENFSKDELSDIFEVLDSILRFKKYKKGDIVKGQMKKRKIRGGFKKWIILDNY
jgi:predicted house-cleaning noncanonical NTP pyrophosphatase (MazG superfamily)